MATLDEALKALPDCVTVHAHERPGRDRIELMFTRVADGRNLHTYLPADEMARMSARELEDWLLVRAAQLMGDNEPADNVLEFPDNDAREIELLQKLTEVLEESGIVKSYALVIYTEVRGGKIATRCDCPPGDEAAIVGGLEVAKQMIFHPIRGDTLP